MEQDAFEFQEEESMGKDSVAGGGRWTDEEHSRFIEALRLYGKDWQMVENHIGTRTAAQLRSHAQKFYGRIKKNPNTEGADLKEILSINLRCMKRPDKMVDAPR